MSDYNSSLPVRTEAAGDVIVKVADATIPSQQLEVDSSGRVTVKIQDSSGDTLESTSGALHVTTAGQSIEVTATDLDIRDLDQAQDSVEVFQATHDNLNLNANLQVGDADVANGNPVPVSDAGGSLTVDATDLDIRDLDAGQDNVAISDGTDTLEVNADGSLNAVVTATDLDIRDLVFATDKVDVSGSEVSLDAATLAALESITVQNPSGAGAVNIQDGGNSITVDGAVTVSATDLDIRDLAFATDKVDVSGSSVDVTATDLDIRDLTHVSDSVKVGDGTDFLAVNTDGSINVVMQEDSGLEVVNYNTAASLASSSSSNHDWTSAAASKLYQVLASASGKLKVEVQIETAAASNIFNTIAVGFNSTANPNINIALSKYAAVPNGARVRVIRTNLDNQAQDVYSTIVAVQG